MIQKQKFYHVSSIIVFVASILFFYLLGGGTETENIVEETSGVNTDIPEIGNHMKIGDSKLDNVRISEAFDERKRRKEGIANSSFEWFYNDTLSNHTPSSSLDSNEEQLMRVLEESDKLVAEIKMPGEEKKNISSRTGSVRSSGNDTPTTAEQRRAEFEQKRDARLKRIQQQQDSILAAGTKKDETNKQKKEEEKKIYAEIDNGNTKKGFYSISSAENNINRDIRAVVHGEYKNISTGSQVKLRLLDNIKIGNVRIPKNTFVYALLSFGNGRAQLKTEQINYNGKMIPFEGIIYDRDGFMGLYIPDNTVSSTKKKAGAEVVSGVDLNISSPSSFVSSAINSVTGAVQSAVSGSIRDEKITISANYQLIIKQE